MTSIIAEPGTVLSLEAATDDVVRIRGASPGSVYTIYPDAALLDYLSVAENLALLRGNDSTADWNSELDIAGIGSDARGLSLEDRRRVHLAAALSSEAAALVLDDTLSDVSAEFVDAARRALAHRAWTSTVVVVRRSETGAGEIEVEPIR